MARRAFAVRRSDVPSRLRGTIDPGHTLRFPGLVVGGATGIQGVATLAPPEGGLIILGASVLQGQAFFNGEGRLIRGGIFGALGIATVDEAIGTIIPGGDAILGVAILQGQAFINSDARLFIGNAGAFLQGVATVFAIGPGGLANVADYTIQPTGAFALDTWLDSATGNTDDRHGLEETIQFGKSTADQHAIIEIPLRAVRPGAVVITDPLTELYLTVTSSPSGTFVATFERMARKQWDQPTATWNEMIAGANWSAGGGDISVTDTPASFDVTIPTSGDIVVNNINALTVMIQDALDNRASKLLLRIRSATAEAGSEVVTIASGQNTDASKAPRLKVRTTETNLGYPYPGIKQTASAWTAGRGTQPSRMKYMAIGIGSQVDTLAYKTRRSLKEEIMRKPVIGMSSGGADRTGHVWAHFGVGDGAGDITEVALFADDVTRIEGCDDHTLWTSPGTTVLSTETTDYKEGTGALEMTQATAVTNSFIADLQSISIETREFNRDDHIMYWLYIDDASRLTSFKLALTETAPDGWLQPNIASGLVNGWNIVDSQYSGDTLVSRPGPERFTRIRFLATTITGATVIRVDNIRMVKHEEDIMTLVPVTFTKAIGDDKKYFVKLDSKRGA